jgi:hypothetical protein
MKRPDGGAPRRNGPLSRSIPAPTGPTETRDTTVRLTTRTQPLFGGGDRRVKVVPGVRNQVLLERLRMCLTASPESGFR